MSFLSEEGKKAKRNGEKKREVEEGEREREKGIRQEKEHEKERFYIMARSQVREDS